MKKISNKKTRQRKVHINTIVTILSLIIVPFIGIFMLIPKSLKWKSPTKTIAGVITILYLPSYLGFMAWLFWAGGIHYIGPHDTQALLYLENRYHEEFIIGRVTSRDPLGGAQTYHKLASPKNNPQLEFSISRCLANCGAHGPTGFKDSYPQKKWSQQLTQRFGEKLELTSKQEIKVFATTQSGNSIIDKHNGAIPYFYDLSPDEKKLINVSVSYDEHEGSYTLDTREDHANRILNTASYLRETGAIAKSITYDIHTNTPSTAVPKHSRDVFNFKSTQPLKLIGVDTVYPLFTVSTYGRGAIKEGYELQQSKLNISRGQSTGAYKPSAADISKAKHELALANDIRNKISSNYLVAPYVVVSTTHTDDSAVLDYDNISPTDYIANVSVYNYPNSSVPMSDDRHVQNILGLTDVLKNKFRSSSLSYKKDFVTCNVEDISSDSNVVNAVNRCFIE